ncbi:uncharacterized protein [Amphiura filiformis]|uniref:uncharacterized protein n=1 Tax=Amphiura filiformis TaxID=82378 RepID=UPI003B2263EB
MVKEKSHQMFLIVCLKLSLELSVTTSLEQEPTQMAINSTGAAKSPPTEPLNAKVSDETGVCKLNWDPPKGFENTKLNYTVYFTARHLKAFGIYASAKINKTGQEQVSRSYYDARKINLQAYSLYEFTITANNSKGEGPPCECPDLQCKTPKRDQEPTEWSQTTILTFVFLCSALLIGGCGMPIFVMYCRKRQQMTSSTQEREDRDQDSDSEGHNYLSNVYI